MNYFSQKSFLIKYLPSIFGVIIVLVLGLLSAYLVKRYLQKWAKRSKHQTMATFLMNLIYISILLLMLVIILAKLGVPTASLVAVMGAASLAIGFALRDFLANIAAGFLIIFLKPFKMGDYIEVNGTAGTIVNINLFMTELKSPGSEGIFLPNNKIIANNIVNKTFHRQRRLDFTVGVSYNADLKKTKQVILTLLSQLDFVVQEPLPIVAVQNLADSAVVLLIRFWVNQSDCVNSQLQILEKIKEVLDKNDIDIPYPQLDVHLTSTSE